MELVEATTDDLNALVNRWCDLAKAMEDYSELNHLIYADIEEVSDDGFRTRLDDENITDYLIDHNGETIGFVTLREGSHPSRKHAQYLRIVDFAIDEAYRNQGHGTEVVKRVRELARMRGCDHLKVSCEWENENARRFHRDTGFQPKQIDYVQPLE
jgi:ribosomal protein S18 acetylase RimI-like enzyme